MEDIKNIINKLKDYSIFLDILYQWATKPTRQTAIKKGRPNQNLIKINIQL